MQDALFRKSSGPDIRRVSGRSAPRPHFPSGLSLALDISALENCLALERAADAHPADAAAPVAASSIGTVAESGISTPTAVPYCEFLMSTAEGRLEAVCRLMRSGGDNPIPDALEAGRFRFSPLRTAIRYTREGLLEMGQPSVAQGIASEKAVRLLWDGIIAIMEAQSIGFVCGRESLPWTLSLEKNLAALTERYGLSPELETELKTDLKNHPVTFADSLGTSDRNSGWRQGLSVNLIEALDRGCRLAFEACPSGSHQTLGCLWLASRDMLLDSKSGWSGAFVPHSAT